MGSADASYIRGGIRGGSGASVGHRHLLQIGAAILALGLAGSAIGVGLSASARNDQRGRLARDGIAVQATVTGCVAIGSGVGETITGYTCRGRYTLEGRTYEAVIHGPDNDRAVGSVVAAVAVPGRPSLLTAAGSVPAPRGWWASYLITCILAVLAVASATAAWLLRRRRPATT